MKALIQSVKFIKEVEGKFGLLYNFEVKYDGKKAFYSSKSKEQTKFVEGQEVEFTEEKKTYTNREGKQVEYLVVKPPQFNKQSNFGKALKKEQSRYSGFSESYVKDLLACGLIKPEVTDADVEHNDIVIATWKSRSFEIFEHMVELDKVLEQ